MQVDFFIIGVQKGGTTAIDSYLRHHPSVQMASVKEIHFFDDEQIDWSNPDYTRLHAQFDWSNAYIKVRGEASPIYSYWPQAMQRLHRYSASAKLIMGLRHPSLRAYSHWRMEMVRKLDTLPFNDAIDATGRHRVSEAPKGVHRIFSYVERGFYAPQIEAIFDLFPKGQILFFRTDRLWNDTRATLNKVQAFLGVEFALNVTRRYIAPMTTIDVLENEMEDNIRARLDAIYVDDIRQTMALTGLNLTDWLDGDYREPMHPD